MTSDELVFIGRALHGERWKSPLAARIGVSRDALDHYHSGRRTIPEPTARLLRALYRLPARTRNRLGDLGMSVL